MTKKKHNKLFMEKDGKKDRERDLNRHGPQQRGQNRSTSGSKSRSPSAYHNQQNGYSSGNSNSFHNNEHKRNNYQKYDNKTISGKGNNKVKRNGPQKPLTNQQLSEMMYKTTKTLSYMQKDIAKILGKKDDYAQDEKLDNNLKLNETHFANGDDNTEEDDIYYDVMDDESEEGQYHDVNFVNTTNGQKIDPQSFMGPQGQLIDIYGVPINITRYINNAKIDGCLNIFEKEIKVYYADRYKKGMTMDSGAPKNVTGKRWLQEFIKENKLSKEEMNPRKVKEKFLFGSGELYHADTQVDIPMRIINDEGNAFTIKMEACIVEADIPLLIGGEALEREGFALFFEKGDNICILRRNNTVKGMNFPLKKTGSGHYLLESHPHKEPIEMKIFLTKEEKIEEVEKTKNKLKNEENVIERVKKLHRVTNHKSKNNMEFIYKQGGKDNIEVKKAIGQVVDSCPPCQKRQRSDQMIL